MKKEVVWKCLSPFLVINLVSFVLTGCVSDCSGEGQNSAAGDPVSRYMESREREDSVADNPVDGPVGGGLDDGRDGQPDIMENPAYNPNGRQVLTAVVTSPSITSEILERIQAFNANNVSYFVEIMDYKAEGARVLEAEDLETRLPLEILSGKGPDLVIWDGYYTPALASEILMMDLYDLMDADQDFHREDYFENILQAFERNGGLYILPSSFAVSTMCGKAEELGTDRGITEGWEFGEILEAFENSSHAEVVFDYPNKEYTLNYVVGGCMGNFVDWNSGECHFDTPEFVEMLEFCNTLPDGVDDLPESYYEFYSSGIFVYHGGGRGIIPQHHREHSPQCRRGSRYNGYHHGRGRGVLRR